MVENNAGIYLNAVAFYTRKLSNPKPLKNPFFLICKNDQIIRKELLKYRPVGEKSALAHLLVFLIKNGNLKNYKNLKELNRNSAHIDP